MSISTRTPETVTINQLGNSTTVAVRGQGEVLVRANADSITNVQKIGNDLIVTLSNGEQFTIEGYFINESGIDVLFVSDDGAVSVMTGVRGGGVEPLVLQLVDAAAAGEGVCPNYCRGHRSGAGAAETNLWKKSEMRCVLHSK